MDRERRERFETALRLQAGACGWLGSPLYAGLLGAALEDLQAGGPVARIAEHWEGDPLRGFFALRLLGAVHHRVLTGEAPELARFYPSVGGSGDARDAWPALHALLEADAERLLPQLASVPQTNEVSRCGALLGGFLEISRRTARPLHLRELGCSAGLLLLFDRYHYRLGAHRWGDAASPVAVEAEWKGPPAPFGARLAVASRAGCDLAPADPTRDADVQRLESYVWPDQVERLTRLRAALALARRDPPRVERASAADWLEAELAPAPAGGCTVVYHSTVWMYLSETERGRIRALLAASGARADAERPLAWLRNEDGADPARIEVRLTLWPGGGESLLAEGHHHGRRIAWRGAAADQNE